MKQDKRKWISVAGSIAHVQRVVFGYTSDKDLLAEVKRRKSTKCEYWSIGDRCHNPGNVCPVGTDDHHNSQEN